ncbi:MAG: aminoglycoside phosphotransferase (APT) family kinase protein [Candidatus Poriferisodalaceae bacterium]|jgi:aminoglycoside phosphotransferase (APT) family kinase protein
MTRQIHKHEADNSEATVRVLLAEQCPQWIGASLSWLDTSGTDNVMWRIHQESGPDLVLRLPRIASGARGVDTELGLLPQLAGRLPARAPSVRRAGEPTQVFPHPWAV